jgi:hypothetical protein
MVLSAQPPINVWKDRLIFIVYCAKDTTAHFGPFPRNYACSKRRGLSAFSTYLTKKHGLFNITKVERSKKINTEK